MRRTLVSVMVFAAISALSPASAAEIRVLTAGAFKPIVLAITPEFEKQSGHALIVDNDTAGALQRRILGGEAFDVAVVTPAVIKELAEKGKIVAGTQVNLARTAVGVAVKEGAAQPDIRTVESFKAALLAATKVAYIDPAAGGSSGIYFSKLLETMGIADVVRAKAVLVPGGLVAQRLVTAEADLAIHQISEILAVRGATLVGPLPREIQNYTTYAGGLGTGAAQPEAAKALIAFLNGDLARRVLAEKGMEAAGD